MPVQKSDENNQQETQDDGQYLIHIRSAMKATQKAADLYNEIMNVNLNYALFSDNIDQTFKELTFPNNKDGLIGFINSQINQQTNLTTKKIDYELALTLNLMGIAKGSITVNLGADSPNYNTPSNIGGGYQQP